MKYKLQSNLREFSTSVVFLLVYIGLDETSEKNLREVEWKTALLKSEVVYEQSNQSILVYYDFHFSEKSIFSISKLAIHPKSMICKKF